MEQVGEPLEYLTGRSFLPPITSDIPRRALL